MLGPSKFPILQFFQFAPGVFSTPWPKYNFPQKDFMIFRNFNVSVSSATNLGFWETVLWRNYEYGCACFSYLSKWLAGSIVE